MSVTTYRGPLNPNPADGEAGIVIYGYIPSFALGIVGVVTFGIILVTNLFYLFMKKGYRSFHALLSVGALMEMGGYAARIISHRRPFVISAFVAQYFLIVVAPVLFSAAIYLSLSLAIDHYPRAQDLLIIRPKLVLIYFITADVVTTLVQVVGAALIGVSESRTVRGESTPVTPAQANNILIAGLAIQTFSFITFLVIFSSAIRRLTSSAGHESSKGLKGLFWVILATSLLILLRTVFRLGESAQGFFGYASSHESLFGCLEYLPVILALIVWSILPPSRFLLDRNHELAAAVQEKGSSSITA